MRACMRACTCACVHVCVCLYLVFCVDTVSRHDVCMILSQRIFNPQLRLHHTPDGAVFSFEEMCQFSGDLALMESVFELQSRLQNLQLTDEENCVLAAFTVMFTGVYTLTHTHTHTHTHSHTHTQR